LLILIGSGLFSGFIPVAPATFSCIISIILWWLIPAKIPYIIIGLSLFIMGIFISDRLSKIWGNDPKKVTIDEYASFLLPLYFTPKSFIPLLIAFVLFRFFDIVKPPPIRSLEKLPGGWGIMLDDLLAAVYTTIIILLLPIVHNLIGK